MLSKLTETLNEILKGQLNEKSGKKNKPDIEMVRSGCSDEEVKAKRGHVQSLRSKECIDIY